MTGVLIPCARPHSFTQSISAIERRRAPTGTNRPSRSRFGAVLDARVILNASGYGRLRRRQLQRCQILFVLALNRVRIQLFAVRLPLAHGHASMRCTAAVVDGPHRDKLEHTGADADLDAPKAVALAVNGRFAFGCLQAKHPSNLLQRLPHCAWRADDQARRIQQALLQLKVGAEQRFLSVLSIERGDHGIRNAELQLAVRGHHVAEDPPALVRVQRFRRPASGIDVLVVISETQCCNKGDLLP